MSRQHTTSADMTTTTVPSLRLTSQSPVPASIIRALSVDDLSVGSARRHCADTNFSINLDSVPVSYSLHQGDVNANESASMARTLSSPSLPSPRDHESVHDTPRFLHAQDSFRQLLHRKSSAMEPTTSTNKDRRHTVSEAPRSERARRDTVRPRSLFDTQDSVRELIRRNTETMVSRPKQRWSLQRHKKAMARIHVTSTAAAGPSRRTLDSTQAPGSSESCVML